MQATPSHACKARRAPSSHVHDFHVARAMHLILLTVAQLVALRTEEHDAEKVRERVVRAIVRQKIPYTLLCKERSVLVGADNRAVAHLVGLSALAVVDIVRQFATVFDAKAVEQILRIKASHLEASRMTTGKQL